MRNVNRKPGGPEHVAEYFRNSSELSEASIERQKSAVEPLVKKEKWHVVEVIEDKDISGSETDKRPGLQRLLALVQAGAIDGIVVDDFDRLLRLDMFDMGELLAPLRRAGVWIHSVSQGRLEYHSMTGRLMMGMTSEAKHGEMVAAARRTLAQHLRMARDLDSPPLPRTLYGYVRVEDMDRPPNKIGKRFGKWVIDQEKAEVVRSIFRWYAEGKAKTWICHELARRSILTSTGKSVWCVQAIAHILGNPAYVGDRAYGRVACGKFFHLENGDLAPTIGKPSFRRKHYTECHLSTETHPAIIDRDLWNTVQSRMERAKRKEIDDAEGGQARPGGETPTPGGDRSKYILTRLLVCGKCGAWMTGETRPRGKRVKGYVCAAYQQYRLHGCVRCAVSEDQILPLVISELRSILSADRQQWLRDQLRQRLIADRRQDRLAGLRKQLKAEEGELARCRQRLTRVSEDMIPEVEAMIRVSRSRVADLEKDIDQVEGSDPTRDLETAVDAAAKALWHLEDAVEGDRREKLREVLMRLIEKIVVQPVAYDWHEGRQRHRASKIEVYLRRGTGLDLLVDLTTNRSASTQVLTIHLSA